MRNAFQVSSHGSYKNYLKGTQSFRGKETEDLITDVDWRRTEVGTWSR